ncbi:MAG: anti-sigma factor [Planctomycetota bacterium]
MTKRPIDDERIADWVDDELDEVQRTRFEAELRVNPQLRAAAEAYRDRVMALRGALRGGESLGPQFTDRVMAATVARREERRWRVLPLLGSALAASLLVGLWFVAQRLSTGSVDREPLDKDSLAFVRPSRESIHADGPPAGGAAAEEQAELTEIQPKDKLLGPGQTRWEDARQPAALADDEAKSERSGFFEAGQDVAAGAAEPELRAGVESQESSTLTARRQAENEVVRGSAEESLAAGEKDLRHRLRGIFDSESAPADRESKDVFFLGRDHVPGVSSGASPSSDPSAARGGEPRRKVDLLDLSARSAMRTIIDSPTDGARDSLGALVYLVELPSPAAANGRPSVDLAAFELGVPLVPLPALPGAPAEVADSAPVAEAPGAYVARPSDEVYTIEGEPQLMDAALGRLAEGVRRVAGRLSVRRWFAPPSTATKLGQPEPTRQDGEQERVTEERQVQPGAAQRPAHDSTWIVIRRLPAVVPPVGGPTPGGPSSPGPAGSQGPPPATTPPKKSGVEKPK